MVLNAVLKSIVLKPRRPASWSKPVGIYVHPQGHWQTITYTDSDCIGGRLFGYKAVLARLISNPNQNRSNFKLT